MLNHVPSPHGDKCLAGVTGRATTDEEQGVYQEVGGDAPLLLLSIRLISSLINRAKLFHFPSAVVPDCYSIGVGKRFRKT